MTQAEKLEALVRKAVEKGLDQYAFHSLPITSFHIDIEVGLFGKFVSNDGEEIDVATVIYSKDFARALFGEEYIDLPYDYFGDTREDYEFGDVLPEYPWQLHTQQAVISSDPIGYMYKVVFSEF
jgi:hypothetical protein